MQVQTLVGYPEQKTQCSFLAKRWYPGGTTGEWEMYMPGWGVGDVPGDHKVLPVC